MKTIVLEVTKKIPRTVTLPDGIYTGVWCAYNVEVEYNKETYSMKTEDGIRGTSKAIVTIKDGQMTVECIKN